MLNKFGNIRSKTVKKISIILVFVFCTTLVNTIPAKTKAASTFTLSPTTATYGQVTVTISYSTGNLKQYSLDGTNWINYTAPIAITQNNTTVYARYGTGTSPNIKYTSLGSTKITNIIDDVNNGNWSLMDVTLKNTQEAELMYRTGNINNFGYGWDTGFDPFSGNTTNVHSYPWTAPSDSSQATDRIMVNSGYVYGSGKATDGYTSSTSRTTNVVRDINLKYDLGGITVDNAILQMFVDDFQAGAIGDNISPHRFNGQYIVKINKVEIPELETVINNLNQSGPRGRMITFQIPDKYIDLVRSGSLAINIDDPISKEGDGYAIDFVKLLVNPKSLSKTCTVTGTVTDAYTKAPIAGALINAGGVVQTTSASDGSYTLYKVAAGSPVITAAASGYAPMSQTIYQAVAQNSYKLDFAMQSTAKPGKPEITENPVTLTNQNVQVTVSYPDNPSVRKISVSKNGGSDNYVDYTGAVTIGSDWTASGNTWTVKAKSQSAAGVWSDEASTVISNIDKSIPPAPALSQNPTAPTNGSVVVTVQFPSSNVQVGSQKISLDGGRSYNVYTVDANNRAYVTLYDNATVMAKYSNSLGTESLIGIQVVGNIDKSVPAKPIISYTPNTLLDGTTAVAINVSYPGTTAIQKVSLDNGGTWYDWSQLSSGAVSNIMTSNNTVLAQSTNQAGTKSEIASLPITTIKPGTPILTEDITALTNSNVNITVQYPVSAVTKKYSTDNGSTWYNYTGPISIGSNITVKAQCADRAGTYSDIGFINITNIDKTPPTAVIDVIRINSDGSQVVGIISRSEDITVTDMSSLPKNASGNANYTTNELTVYSDCTVTFTFKDAAGNTGTATKAVYVISGPGGGGNPGGGSGGGDTGSHNER